MEDSDLVSETEVFGSVKGVKLLISIGQTVTEGHTQNKEVILSMKGHPSTLWKVK